MLEEVERMAKGMRLGWKSILSKLSFKDRYDRPERPFSNERGWA